MQATYKSRSAFLRAKQFHLLARECPAGERINYEAFIEAAIIFARASIHRLKTECEDHPKWRAWWDGLSGNEAVEFFRTERDWLLKEAPPRIGQRAFAASVGNPRPSYEPSKAAEFYFFGESGQLATETIGRHLDELDTLLAEAAVRFK